MKLLASIPSGKMGHDRNAVSSMSRAVSPFLRALVHHLYHFHPLRSLMFPLLLKIEILSFNSSPQSASTGLGGREDWRAEGREKIENSSADVSR